MAAERHDPQNDVRSGELSVSLRIVARFLIIARSDMPLSWCWHPIFGVGVLLMGVPTVLTINVPVYNPIRTVVLSTKVWLTYAACEQS